MASGSRYKAVPDIMAGTPIGTFFTDVRAALCASMSHGVISCSARRSRQFSTQRPLAKPADESLLASLGNDG